MDKLDIYVYTDIKGIRKAKGSYIWLIEMQKEQGPVTLWDKKETEEVTGRYAELTALTEALSRVTKPCRISLHISNDNLMNVFRNKWVEVWSSSGWLDSRGEPIKDSEKWQQFYERFKIHEIEEISISHHSYSSWMQNQIGDSKSETSESRISSSYDTISKFHELIESLDTSDFEENAELQTLINRVCETLFRKFKIVQTPINTGTVKVENPQTLISGFCGESVKIANADKHKA